MKFAAVWRRSWKWKSLHAPNEKNKKGESHFLLSPN
jgi:hypothetical protein